MFNQSLPFALITLGDFLPHVIFAGMFFWLFGIAMIIRYLRSREEDARAAMNPLCVWHYNPSEWQEAAAVYDLAKFPKGAARIQLTLLDV